MEFKGRGYQKGVFQPSHKRASTSNRESIFDIGESRSFIEARTIFKFSPLFDTSTKANLEVDKGKKSVSVVTRLNDEVNILSSQLYQSNKVVSFYTEKINRNKEKIRKLLENLDDFSKQVKSLELENKALKDEVEVLKISRENDRKKFELEQEKKEMQNEQKMQEVVHECKKEKIAIETHFIDLISRLNHRFLEEVEFINKRFRKKIGRIADLDSALPDFDRDFELSTFIAQDGVTVIKGSAFSSPTRNLDLKKLDEEDFDLKSLCVTHGKYQKVAAKEIFELCRKHCSRVLKSSFSAWGKDRKNIDKFCAAIERTCFKVKCVFFIYLVRVEKLGKLEGKIQRKKALKKWVGKCALLRQNKEKIKSLIGIYQLLFKRILTLKTASWARMENYNSKLEEKKLVKKCLDIWLNHRFSNYELKCQCFYKWKSFKSLQKFAELKSIKSVFQVN